MLERYRWRASWALFTAFLLDFTKCTVLEMMVLACWKGRTISICVNGSSREEQSGFLKLSKYNSASSVPPQIICSPKIAHCVFLFKLSCR